MKMDIHEILRKLPHRYPIILVDRVLELVPGERIVALKNVTINEPYFMGHFPGHPVMPGVLIIESLAQACAILAFVTLQAKEGDGTLFYFAGIDARPLQEARHPGRPVAPRSRDGAREARRGQVHRPGAGRRAGRLRDGNDVRGPQYQRGRLMAKVASDRGRRPAGRARGRRRGRPVLRGRTEGEGRGRPRCSSRTWSSSGRTTIGSGNRFFPFCAIGGAPQDKKYGGEDTELVIGDGNTVREHCTFSLGTAQGGGVTRVGSDNWIMASVHVAHDCIVGDHTILANNVTLAGHVTLGDWVVIGGLSGLHQFCSMGAHAMAGGGSIILRDIPPYVICNGNPCTPHGVNTEGLKRRGFDAGHDQPAAPRVQARVPRRQDGGRSGGGARRTDRRGARVGVRHRAAARLRARFAEGHHPLMDAPSSIAFVAGEASGDLLAAGVLAELKRRDPALAPVRRRRRPHDRGRLRRLGTRARAVGAWLRRGRSATCRACCGCAATCCGGSPTLRPARLRRRRRAGLQPRPRGEAARARASGSCTW